VALETNTALQWLGLRFNSIGDAEDLGIAASLHRSPFCQCSALDWRF
jgi:hypothetical protein